MGWGIVGDGPETVVTPSHGGNTGSNPVGDANNFNELLAGVGKLLTNFSQRCGWTALENAGPSLLFRRSTGKLGDRPNAASSYPHSAESPGASAQRQASR